MRKNENAFAIAELIIIVVLSSALCVILVIAYGGAVARSRTAQTTDAAEQWLKALQLHKSHSGRYPTISGCLGSNYQFDISGTATTGVGQCQQENAETGMLQDSSLDASLAKYIADKPTPAFVTASNSSTDWRRGIYYDVTTENAELSLVVDGTQTATTCPIIGGLSASSAKTFINGGTGCTYTIGAITTD